MNFGRRLPHSILPYHAYYFPPKSVRCFQHLNLHVLTVKHTRAGPESLSYERHDRTSPS